MVAVIDYNTGNLRSVCNALQRIGAEFTVTADHDAIRNSDKVVMPGVGEAAWAMSQLRERGLDTLIKDLIQPVLGICIGMQLMCRHSEEGDAECLGIFDTEVRRLTPNMTKGIKVPHMGWNELTITESSPLMQGIKNGEMVYFVHSYAADLSPYTIAISRNGRDFSAALAKDNFYGVQFHPEKSGDVGELILSNFLQFT